MLISTKGRYALRVMVAMAQRGGEEYIPIKEIAEQENISLKYLESIMTMLSKGGLVEGGALAPVYHRLSQAERERLEREQNLK